MNDDKADIRPPHIRYGEKESIGSSHDWAKDTCRNLVKRETASVVKALDIGPGSGLMGRWLRENNVIDISAIEIDEETRKVLAELYDPIKGDLNSLDNSKKYSLVLLLDVLEHMAAPDTFLEELATHLEDGAILLISVPNITHWAVRTMVLFGYFEYMEKGPLDRTHLQFFSRRRFVSFVKSIPGYSSAEFSASIFPLELFIPESASKNYLFRLFSKFRIVLTKLWPALFAYQHLAAVKFNSSNKL